MALDRVTKALWAEADQVVLPEVLALRGTKNTGMAMGLMQGKTIGVLILSLALVGVCAAAVRRWRPGGWAVTGLSLMAGGALGNMIDRVFSGAVIDFFDLLFMKFYIFNVADVGVVVGAVLCGISLLFRPQDWSGR